MRETVKREVENEWIVFKQITALRVMPGEPFLLTVSACGGVSSQARADRGFPERRIRIH